LGLYQVAVDRSDLAAGVYAADIIARSSVNTLTVRVIMSAGGDQAGDVGVVYILLYEQGAEDPVAQLFATARDGRYQYAFADLPRGRYQIFAGSDADNDLLICDAGEACGSWLTVDQPASIELESNRDDINFPVDYQIAIPTISAGGKAARPVRGQAEPKRRRK
jgi:serine protease